MILVNFKIEINNLLRLNSILFFNNSSRSFVVFLFVVFMSYNDSFIQKSDAEIAILRLSSIILINNYQLR